MKRKQRFTCLEVSILVILSVGCMAALLGFGGYFIIPQMVEDTFGPPSANLSSAQKITAAVELLLNRESLKKAVDPAGSPVKFTVRLGETANSVSARLEESGLVVNGGLFRTYLVYTGLDTSIQAGEYTLSPAMTPQQIALELQDATPETVKFIILPGWRAEEIAAALPTSGLSVRAEVFLRTVNSPPDYVLPPGWEAGMGLEGYLYPGAYEFNRNATADNLVAAFALAFDQAVSDELIQALANQGLSLAQAVTLASIVQREAVVSEEQPMIASVFLNRLAEGIKLDSDPTVQYAVGFNQDQNTWWTNPLSRRDLQVNSPYNTYLNTGLPPGPICNPALSALQAVAYPAQTPYYYFRAACDGSGRHLFARTYEEHLQNACP